MTRFLRRKYIVYIGIIIALLPLMVLRDYTPSNELRYLSIADEALRNHTFFTFYNHGEIYADKPPFYFWLLMLCKWIVGDYRMWMLSLFSLLPALGILQVMDNWVKDEMDKEHRSLAMLMLLFSGLFLGCAVFLRMDMLMSFFIVLALCEFWRMYIGEEASQRSRWLFPVYLFLAVFTKGPFGILIPLCATLFFLIAVKRVGEFFRYWGWRTWGVLALLCACWFAGIYIEGGKAYLDDLLIHQTVGRAVNSFHHKEAFYYYLLHIWYCSAPWSLLAVGLFVTSWRSKFAKSELLRFFQIVFLSTFVLLSCVSAKLQIYILPAIPFLIYIVAMCLMRKGSPWWMKCSLAVPAVIFVLVLPLLLVVCSQEEVFAWGGGWAYVAATVLAISGLLALLKLYRMGMDGSIENVIWYLGMGLLLTVFVGGFAMPRINMEMGYGPLCEQALGMSQKWQVTDIRTWSIPRSESMDVYLRQPVKVIPSYSLPLGEHGKSYLLLTKNSLLPKVKASYDKKLVICNYAIVIVEKY